MFKAERDGYQQASAVKQQSNRGFAFCILWPLLLSTWPSLAGQGQWDLSLEECWWQQSDSKYPEQNHIWERWGNCTEIEGLEQKEEGWPRVSAFLCLWWHSVLSVFWLLLLWLNMVSMHDQDNYENKECSLRKMYHLDEGAFKKIHMDSQL